MTDYLWLTNWNHLQRPTFLHAFSTFFSFLISSYNLCPNSATIYLHSYYKIFGILIVHGWRSKSINYSLVMPFKNSFLILPNTDLHTEHVISYFYIKFFCYNALSYTVIVKSIGCGYTKISFSISFQCMIFNID